MFFSILRSAWVYVLLRCFEGIFGLNHYNVILKTEQKYTVRIVSFWYANQTMQVKWDDCVYYLPLLRVSNGVSSVT